MSEVVAHLGMFHSEVLLRVCVRCDEHGHTRLDCDTERLKSAELVRIVRQQRNGLDAEVCEHEGGGLVRARLTRETEGCVGLNGIETLQTEVRHEKGGEENRDEEGRRRE